MIRLISPIILCLVLAACGSRPPASLDLAAEFPYADRISNSFVLFPGTPQAKAFLLTGWGDVERNEKESFRWIVEDRATMVIPLQDPKASVVTFQMKSFFPNAAELYWNGSLLQTLPVSDEDTTFAVPVPQEILRKGNNLVELRFAETRTPAGTRENRRLAAAVKSIALGDSGNTEYDFTRNEVWSLETVDLGAKKLPAIFCRRSGILRYYAEVTSESMLEFGSYFQPAAIAEDTASFHVWLIDPAGKKKPVWEGQYQDKAMRFHKLTLPVEKPGLHAIDFEIRKNGISPAAILAPRLFGNVNRRPVHQDVEVESIRRENRGANVIILLLDAASAEYLSTYGYHRPTTPNIDALARDGVAFEDAYCQAVYTLASTGSLMSGLYPLHHRVLTVNLRNPNKLPSELITMAEAFSAAGYETGTFVANGNASSTFGMTQGFKTAEEVFRDPNYSGWGQDITDRVTAWMGRNSDKRLFAYVHYREPHAPFRPPDPWRDKFVDPNYNGFEDDSFNLREQINRGEVQVSKADLDFIKSLYDGNLAYADSQVGLVVRKLRELNLYDNTIIVVLSDHGEAFWQHGFQGHNSQVYQESMRIPLIIKPAGTSLAGKRIAAPVRSIDLYPTLVDLLGFSRRNISVDGRSFLPCLSGAPADGREVISQTTSNVSYAYLEDGYKYIVGLGYDKTKLLEMAGVKEEYRRLLGERAMIREKLYDEKMSMELLHDLVVSGLAIEELYDLKNDPAEKNNLAHSNPFLTGYYRSRLYGWFISSPRPVFGGKEEAVMDESTRENLKALGYIGDE